MYALIEYKPLPSPWNKGKIAGPKPPLRPQEVWSIRIHLQMKAKGRDFALFDLAIDSKLRGCDSVRLNVGDVPHGSIVQSRAKIIQQKTPRPVEFEITDQTRASLEKWISEAPWGQETFSFRADCPPLHIFQRDSMRAS
jgi:hypothetical protein